jgi:hypothetical protein
MKRLRILIINIGTRNMREFSHMIISTIGDKIEMMVFVMVWTKT